MTGNYLLHIFVCIIYIYIYIYICMLCTLACYVHWLLSGVMTVGTEDDVKLTIVVRPSVR